MSRLIPTTCDPFHSWESEKKRKTKNERDHKFLSLKWRAFGQDKSFFLIIMMVSFTKEENISLESKVSSLLRLYFDQKLIVQPFVQEIGKCVAWMNFYSQLRNIVYFEI